MTVETRKVIPAGSKATFTNRNTDANPHRGTTTTTAMGRNSGTRNSGTRNSGTSTVTIPGKRYKGGPSINPMAGMPPDICARLEGTNPNHAMRGKTSGSANVPETGNMSIIAGTNVAATADTAFRKIASVRILAVDTGFASTTSQSW
jgi:hypothetical protein